MAIHSEKSDQQRFIPPYTIKDIWGSTDLSPLRVECKALMCCPSEGLWTVDELPIWRTVYCRWVAHPQGLCTIDVLPISRTVHYWCVSHLEDCALSMSFHPQRLRTIDVLHQLTHCWWNEQSFVLFRTCWLMQELLCSLPSFNGSIHNVRKDLALLVSIVYSLSLMPRM